MCIHGNDFSDLHSRLTHSLTFPPSTMLNSTRQSSIGRGWQNGIRSLVRLAACTPAMTAVVNTGPFFPTTSPPTVSILDVTSGGRRTRLRAVAVRRVVACVINKVGGGESVVGARGVYKYSWSCMPYKVVRPQGSDSCKAGREGRGWTWWFVLVQFDVVWVYVCRWLMDEDQNTFLYIRGRLLLRCSGGVR